MVNTFKLVIVVDNFFLERGFTEVKKVKFQNNELINLQKLIYSLTKNQLVDHSQELSIEKKINLPFKEIPSQLFWSKLMDNINNSNELKNLIYSQAVRDVFKLIFTDPSPYEISAFRARVPEQKRVIYNWHQDEGTWYLSSNNNHLNKFPSTLWFSINGASKEDSIQLVKFSHKKKLHNHKYVEGQGYFNIREKLLIDEKNIYTVETKISECIIFHPFTIHRSVPANKVSLRPRYTIDIRYFDKNFKVNNNIDLFFRIKKFLHNFL